MSMHCGMKGAARQTGADTGFHSGGGEIWKLENHTKKKSCIDRARENSF